MRKILVTLMLISLLVLAGCSKKPVEDPVDTTVFPEEEVIVDDYEEPVSEEPEEITDISDSSVGLGDEAIGEKSIAEMTVEEINAAEFLQTVYFEFDKFDLTENTVRQLEDNGRWLLGNPSVRVIVEGHCDERGTEEYNLALGERRARSVQMFLGRMGIEVNRLQTASYGESRPAERGSNEYAWGKNRRVHFRVFSK